MANFHGAEYFAQLDYALKGEALVTARDRALALIEHAIAEGLPSGEIPTERLAA